MFGLGGYWLGARQQQSVSPHLQLSFKETTSPNKFDLQRILNLVSFRDPKGIKKFLIHYNVDNKQEGYKSVYLSDTTLDWHSAVKIMDVDFQDLANSPFVSYGRDKKKYFVMELIGPGDTADLAIADENGKLITESLLRTNNFKFKNQEFSSYLLRFDRWHSPNTFWSTASPYGLSNEAELSSLGLLIDAEKGKIIESVELCAKP
jgi:hypothetical protein